MSHLCLVYKATQLNLLRFKKNWLAHIVSMSALSAHAIMPAYALHPPSNETLDERAIRSCFAAQAQHAGHEEKLKKLTTSIVELERKEHKAKAASLLQNEVVSERKRQLNKISAQDVEVKKKAQNNYAYQLKLLSQNKKMEADASKEVRAVKEQVKMLSKKIAEEKDFLQRRCVEESYDEEAVERLCVIGKEFPQECSKLLAGPFKELAE